MSRCKHDWHLYNFTKAELVDVSEGVKQLVSARFNFICSGCGYTKHFPPIKDDHKNERSILEPAPTKEKLNG